VRRAVFSDHLEGESGQPLHVLLRVGDGSSAEDELRAGAIVGAEALEAAHHVGHMGTEDAAVDMRLVYYDIPQTREEFLPHAVVGQDAEVHHVGVGEHNLGRPLDSGAFILRCIAVEGGVVQPDFLLDGQFSQAAQLVLGQRLGGEKVEGAASLLSQDSVEDRYVIAQGLAAGRGSDHHHVFPRADEVNRLSLVAVEREQAVCLERFLKPGMQGLVQFPIRCLTGCDVLDMDNLVSVGGELLKSGKKG